MTRRSGDWRNTATDSNQREAFPRSTVFVGRERELAELSSGLSDALGGRGRLLLIVGEPGIGKTRLAGELGDYASRRGARVLWGRCWEGEGAPPYWPWVQMLRSYLRETDPETVALEMGSGAPYVAQIVPEVRERLGALPLPATSLESEHARFCLFDAIATFLTKAADTKTLLLVLDDLHWADKASLLLLQFVAHGLHRTRILALGTYRETEVRQAAEVMDVLAEVGRDAHHLPLSGLSEAEVGQVIEAIAGRPASAALTRTIRQATEGNPFFVDELVRLLAAEGRIARSEILTAGAYPIPEGVREAIRRRLRPLSEECRRILSVACVVGREFDLATLQRLCDLAVERVLVLLGEALAAGMVLETSAPLGRFSFAHALVRELLYDDLGPAERPRLHRRVAETLEALYSPNSEPHLAELAHHFLQAGPAGDPNKAIDYALRAGRRASSLLAHDEAAAHYEHALELLELDMGSEGRRADVLLSLGETLNRAGDPAGARRSLQRAAELSRRLGDPDRLSRAALGFGGGSFGGVWAVSRAHDEALVSLLEEAARGLGSADSILRARVLARLATVLHYAPVRERRESLSREAVDVARRTEDVGALAYALAACHYTMCGPSDVGERLEIADEILRIAEQARDPELALLGRGWRLVDLLEIGDLSRAGHEIEAYARLADELRQPFHAWYATMWRAMHATATGRFEDGERLAREALEIGRRSQEENAAQAFAAQRINLCWLQGRMDDAIAEHERAVSEYFPIAGWRYSLALSHAKAGHADDARRELERAARSEDAGLSHGALRILHPCFEAATVALLADPTRAGPLYDSLRPHSHLAVVGGHEVVTWYGSVSHYLGLLATTIGRPDDAAQHFRDAIAMHERAGARPWLALSAYAYAHVLLTRGAAEDRREALYRSNQALEFAEKIGMRDLAAKAGALRVRAGARESPKSGAAGFAPAERIPIDVVGAAPKRAVTLGSGEEEVMPPRVRPAAPPSERSLFRREGTYWTIGFRGPSVRLKDTIGLRYLAELLRHPGRKVHLTELSACVTTATDSPQTGVRSLADGLSLGCGDAGEILDSRARAGYRARLEDLREELSEAERNGNAERALGIEQEMEALIRELARAVGFGGRERRAGSEIERLRFSVTKAIKTAIRKIRDADSSLGHHLATTIRTGTFCSYTPDPAAPPSWDL